MRASKAVFGVAVAALVAVTGCSVPGTATAIPEESEVAAPASSESMPADLEPADLDSTDLDYTDLDPCDLPLDLLDELDLTGVQPNEVPDTSGCGWGSDTFALGILLIEDVTFIEDPASRTEVSDIEILPFEDYRTYLFVLDGDMYMTQTMTERGAFMVYITRAGDASLADERESLLTVFEAIAPYFPPPR